MDTRDCTCDSASVRDAAATWFTRVQAQSLSAAEQAEFDAFWSVYPRKAGKQPAMLAYIDVVRAGAKPEDIFLGAQLYAGLRQGQDPTHTKMAQGWLNDKRWADEVTEPPQGGYRDHIGARRGTWDPMEQAVAGIGWNEDAA